MPDSPAAVFMQLAQGVADRRYAEVLDLYAPVTDVVHPFDPLRGPALTSREELQAHFGRADGIRPDFQPHIRQIHQTVDPEVIVAEVDYRGERNGKAFSLPNIFVLRVKGGQIVESRDYVDHLTFARLTGRLDALVAAMQAQDGLPAS